MKNFLASLCVLVFATSVAATYGCGGGNNRPGQGFRVTVWQEYQRCRAEAVICIAHKKATWHVVHELESRGMPTFGAIWDS